MTKMLSKQKKIRHKVTLVSAGRSCGFKLLRAHAVSRIQFLLGYLCDFPSAVNIRFCDAAEMQQTNAAFRGKNSSTDVLSFPAVPGTLHEAENNNETGIIIKKLNPNSVYALGDLLVCVPVCRIQARQRGHSLAQEMERMIVHGLVHLKGFDHERGEAAWRVMSALEKALLKQLRAELNEALWAEDNVRSKA